MGKKLPPKTSTRYINRLAKEQQEKVVNKRDKALFNKHLDSHLYEGEDSAAQAHKDSRDDGAEHQWPSSREK
jgi:hypothetical protein